MSTPVFLLTPTATTQETLRRYTYPADCPTGHGGHDAYVSIGERLYEENYAADDFDHNDPRWPTVCACGYAFQASDHWQHTLDCLYAGGPYRGPLQDAPAGALWDATWLHDTWLGSDGKCYVVKLPNGTEWIIDGPSSNGDGWVRSGDAPNLTVQPSILVSSYRSRASYHGFLTDGVLSDDLDRGR